MDFKLILVVKKDLLALKKHKFSTLKPNKIEIIKEQFRVAYR
jgi:hypothetical protein